MYYLNKYYHLATSYIQLTKQTQDTIVKISNVLTAYYLPRDKTKRHLTHFCSYHIKKGISISRTRQSSILYSINRVNPARELIIHLYAPLFVIQNTRYIIILAKMKRRKLQCSKAN
jgi:hypothetical protein